MPHLPRYKGSARDWAHELIRYNWIFRPYFIECGEGLYPKNWYDRGDGMPTHGQCRYLYFIFRRIITNHESFIMEMIMQDHERGRI